MVRLAARRTGFIEVCGPGQDDEIFVQGWATDLPPGRIRVLVASEPPMLTGLASVSYERDDLSGRGKGFAGLLQHGSLGDPASLTQFLYRGDDAWRAVDIYEHRKIIAAGEVPVHLRSLLPRATGPEDVLARLRRTAHRFDGRETVSQLQEPVRLGIDVAVHVPGAGILISGWLLDPKNRVESLRLHAGPDAVVISNDWTRLARADVAGAYSDDPLFRSLISNAKLSGFLAFGRIPSGDAESAHLELDLGDNRPPAFFPLTLTEASPSEALARLLQAVDIRSGAAETIIERQFGPMLRSLEPAPAIASEVTDIGALDAAAPIALVIGGDDRVGETLSLLALLAIDPFARTLPIVLAAPKDALASFAGEIRRLATFYRLSIRLVSSASGSDVYDSLEAGANATNAETLALLSSHVLPGTADWLSRLLQTYRLRGEQHLVSPTILFEDGSVRWAGSWLNENDGRRELTHPHLGYPRAAVVGAGLEQVSAGTLDCCVLPRAALVAANGFAHGYLSLTAKNADMALRIRLAGTPALWQSAIEMLSAANGTPAGAMELTHRIDRWSFDHRWSLALATVRE
jgi:O-antigen biosynthesis protein